ncbi:MAG: MG2 domain-containing protein, partial [bacterium]|nr:MG2 domain-containing protein [bacterium]
MNSNLRPIVPLFLFIIVFMLINFACQPSRQSVKITEFSPVGEVQQSTNFTIAFSQEVVDDSLVNVWLDQTPISFNPPIPGKAQWIDRSKIRFYPDVLLQPATEYTAEISHRLVSPYGFSLAGERAFKFSTPQFTVNSASLNFEFVSAKEKEAKLLATIEFNYDVDPAEAMRFVAIQYKDGGQIPFKLITTSPGRIVELEAESVKRGEEEKEISLKISEGLKPIGGNLGLFGEFIKPIMMPKQQDLKVERLSPKIDWPKEWNIQIQFNMPVDFQSAGQYISIEPAVKYKMTSSHHYISLRGDFSLETTYQVNIRKGLRAIDGSELKRDFSSAVTFRKEEIPPQLGFVGDGFYLTKSGNLNIGLSTINLDKAIIEIDKVYVNNLIYLLNPNDLSSDDGYYWYDIQSLGKRLHESEITIQNIANEEVVTLINIQEYLKEERIGIFNITARQTDRRWNQASRWVLATDMGIVAKKAGNDLWVWVNSLTKLTPVANAEVKLISQNNQMLATKQTSAEGTVVFESYEQYGDALLPYLITVAAGSDFCFLELTRRQIATSDFEVDGAAFLEHGYEAFLYNERGVYRPGETAHLAGIVRGENMAVPTPFPVLFRVKGPDERILEEQRATLNEQGGENDEIGRTNFSVEEFVPDRMKVSLATDKDEYKPGETIEIDVEAMTLFGPPASGRRVQADIEIESFTFSPTKWTTFTFYDEKKSFEKIRTDLEDQVLDDKGRFQYTYDLPTDLDVPSALRGILSTTVLEPGGRGVSAYRSVIIHPYQA